MKKYAIFVIAILALVIFASGCTSSDTLKLNQTFSKGGLTFNYPSNYNEASAGSDLISGASEVQILGTLIDPNDKSNSTFIQVRKLPLHGATVESIYTIQKASFAQVNYQVLTDTQNTVNGIKIYNFIYNGTDPLTEKGVKGYDLIFGKDGDVVYSLQIQGVAESFDTTKDIEQQIENTIKLN